MSKLTFKYLKTQGKEVSYPDNKSLTIAFDNEHQVNRIMKKVKCQSRVTAHSTGYPLRVNFDINKH